CAQQVLVAGLVLVLQHAHLHHHVLEADEPVEVLGGVDGDAVLVARVAHAEAEVVVVVWYAWNATSGSPLRQPQEAITASRPCTLSLRNEPFVATSLMRALAPRRRSPPRTCLSGAAAGGRLLRQVGANRALVPRAAPRAQASGAATAG